MQREAKAGGEPHRAGQSPVVSDSWGGDTQIDDPVTIELLGVREAETGGSIQNLLRPR